MSETLESKKIHIDTLTEKAYEWWNNVISSKDQECYIVNLYMENQDIEYNQVEW